MTKTPKRPAAGLPDKDTLIAFLREAGEAEKADIAINQAPGALIQMPAGSKLTDVVKALNTLGATPQDLVAILQAMKAAGALQADLEVI